MSSMTAAVFTDTNPLPVPERPFFVEPQLVLSHKTAAQSRDGGEGLTHNLCKHYWQRGSPASGKKSDLWRWWRASRWGGRPCPYGSFVTHSLINPDRACDPVPGPQSSPFLSGLRPTHRHVQWASTRKRPSQLPVTVSLRKSLHYLKLTKNENNILDKISEINTF